MQIVLDLVSAHTKYEPDWTKDAGDMAVQSVICNWIFYFCLKSWLGNIAGDEKTREQPRFVLGVFETPLRVFFAFLGVFELVNSKEVRGV